MNSILILFTLLILIYKYWYFYFFTNFVYLLYFYNILLFSSFYFICFTNKIFSFYHIILAIFIYKYYNSIILFYKKRNIQGVSILLFTLGSLWSFELFGFYFIWDFIEVIAVISFMSFFFISHIKYNKTMLLILIYCISLKTFHTNLIFNDSSHKFSKNVKSFINKKISLLFFYNFNLINHFYKLKINNFFIIKCDTLFIRINKVRSHTILLLFILNWTTEILFESNHDLCITFYLIMT